MRVSLLTDALVLVLINAQSKVFAREEYLETIKVLERKARRTSLERTHGSLSYYFYCLEIYLKQFIYTHISKILLFAIFLLIINNKTCLGLLYLAFLILILIIEKENRWSASWIPIYFYSLIIIFSQYLLQLKVAENFLQDLMNWGGFSFEASNIDAIFIQNCFIQFLCILQRKSQQWKKFILSEPEILSFYEDNKQIIADFKHIKKKVQKYRENLIKEQQMFIITEDDIKEEEKQPLTLEVRTSYKSSSGDDQEVIAPANFEIFKNFQKYIMKKPIMDGNWLFYKLEHAYQRIGFELALLLLAVAAFYKLNVISILYILLAAYFSFHCKYLTLEDNFSEKKVRVLLQKWRFVYFLISIGLLFQYAILLWFPLNWNVFYPWKDVLFVCDENSKNSFSKINEFHDESDLVKCLNNWKKWLFLERFKDNELFMDFSVLFMMILYEHYFLILNHNTIDQDIKAEDNGDFTHKRKDWLDWIKFFYYCYFYKLALIVFFIVGAIDDISGFCDIISGIYLIVSMYLTYNSNKLISQKNRIWKKVEAFNNIVMILYVIYQAPIFPCPIVHDEDRYYFTADECLSLQGSQRGFFIWKHYADKQEQHHPDSMYVLYVLFVQTLGLNKFSNNYMTKPFFAIIFFFMGLLQRQIFNHPYTSEYVSEFLKREREDSIRRALRFIENNHLKRIWSYENLKTQKEVYLSLQKRVDRKIKQWEELLTLGGVKSTKSSPALHGKDEKEEEIIAVETHDQKKELTSHDLDAFSEEMRIKAEKVCYDKDLPSLTLSEVLEILEKAQGDDKKAEIMIKLKKFEKKRVNIEAIYASKAINLGIYWPERLKQLCKEEKALQDHILALEHELESQKPLIDQPKELSSSLQKEIDHLKPLSPTKPKPWYKTFWKDVKEVYNTVLESIKTFLLSFTHRTFFKESGGKLENDPFIFIVVYFIISQMDKVCYLMMIVNHIVNDNCLSLIFPLSLFFYALLENPIPLKAFWKFIIFYTVLIIIIKFLYQLPLFCGSPAFTFFYYTGDSACISRGFSEAELIGRIDYIIGIHKFSGNSSYPKNQGFFLGVLCDYLVLLLLLVHRFLLEKLGFWNHVKIQKSLFEIPQFQKKEELALKLAGNKRDLEENPIEKQDFNARNFEDIIDKRLEGLEQEKLGFLDRIFGGIKGFGLRVIPNYLPKEHEFIDIRTKEKKMIPTYPSLIKPGKDYYSPAFAVCLMILAYFIVFYQKMVGKKESISDTLDNNSQFSGDLVLAIILILAWIILDRVIYNLKKSSNYQIKASNVDSYDYGKTAMLLKISIHMLIFILVHYYICFRLPLSAKTFFCNSPALVICYLFFSWYLYYSSFQIKFGYPEADTTQIFTTSTDLFTRMAFKVYRAIPFLTELKAILDWTVIRTSLDLFQWIKLDDAYANLYYCKAEMAVRKEKKRGKPRNFWEKCSNGCLLVILLLVIIIGPILIFSTLNPILETNNVNSGVISLELMVTPKKIDNSSNTAISLASNIFELYHVENLDISGIDSNAFDNIRQDFYGIEAESQSRMQKISILPYSERNWEISRPRVKALENFLSNDKNKVYITAKWSFMRSHPPGNELSKGSNTVLLNENERKTLNDIISGNTSESGKNSIELTSKFKINFLCFKYVLIDLFPFFLNLGQTSYAQVSEFGGNSLVNNNIPSHITCSLTYYGEESGSTSYWGLERKNGTGFEKCKIL